MAFQFIQEFFNGFAILGEISSQTGLQGDAQKLDLESQSHVQMKKYKIGRAQVTH